MAFLKVLESPDPALKDQTIPLAGKEVLIGRGKENGLVLEDHAVSRHHARIVEEPDGHVLVDNNSANGSWVNGQRVTEQRLKPGDQIRVGKTVFEIQGVYDPEGTALLDVQGMGMSMKPAPVPAPAFQPAPHAPGAAPSPPPPAPRPSAPSFDPATGPGARADAQAAHPRRRRFRVRLPPRLGRRRCRRPLPWPPRARPRHRLPRRPRWPPVRRRCLPRRCRLQPPAYFGDEAPIEGEPAGFWIRFLAFMIDYAILGS